MLKRRHVLCVVGPPNQSDSPDKVQIMQIMLCLDPGIL